MFVDKFKCGLAIYKPKKIRKKIEEFIKNPELLIPYIENCKKIDKNQNGAEDVAKYIIEEIRKSDEKGN